jgi:endoglucanase
MRCSPFTPVLILSVLLLAFIIAGCVAGGSDRMQGTNQSIHPTNLSNASNPQPSLLVLRGAVIGPSVGEADLRELASWGANSIRYPMNWNTFPNSPADNATPAEYDSWLDGQLKRLDTLLPVCEELGLHVVVDMHTPVCGRYPDAANPLVMRIFRDKSCQEQFIEDWKMIAKRYKGKKMIWGYDLLNEPLEGDVPPGLMTWRQLAENVTLEIRAIDPNATIIYEPAVDTLGSDITQGKGILPLPYDNVVYSIHMYSPAEFTHQGVGGRPHPVYYPSQIGGTYWDINQQRKLYQPIVDFQKKYNATIYIGEFSVVRWAPAKDAEQCLSDFITIMEENGWSGAYHAFREWNGWSVEYDSNIMDQNPVNYTTKRKQILLDWYAKNKP